MSEQINEEWISAYIDGELSPAEEAMVEDAIHDDPRWRRILEESKALRRDLKELPRFELSHDLSEQILRTAERSLLSGPDEDGSLISFHRAKAAPVTRRLSRVVIGMAVAALAAMLLLAISLPKAMQNLARNEVARQTLDEAAGAAADEAEVRAAAEEGGMARQREADQPDAPGSRAEKMEAFAARPRALPQETPVPAAIAESIGRGIGPGAGGFGGVTRREAQTGIKADLLVELAAKDFDASRLQTFLEQHRLKLLDSPTSREAARPSGKLLDDAEPARKVDGVAAPRILFVSVAPEQLTEALKDLADQPGFLQKVDLRRGQAPAPSPPSISPERKDLHTDSGEANKKGAAAKPEKEALERATPKGLEPKSAANRDAADADLARRRSGGDAGAEPAKALVRVYLVIREPDKSKPAAER